MVSTGCRHAIRTRTTIRHGRILRHHPRSRRHHRRRMYRSHGHTHEQRNRNIPGGMPPPRICFTSGHRHLGESIHENHKRVEGNNVDFTIWKTPRALSHSNLRHPGSPTAHRSPEHPGHVRICSGAMALIGHTLNRKGRRFTLPNPASSHTPFRG